MNYFPKLDGIRALAVTGVLIDHYLPGETGLLRLPWGSLGVQCFFVLSGYLITGILLQAKEQSTSMKVSLKAFYGRRFLRIFPPFYFLLLASLALGISITTETFWSAFFYVLNFLQAAYPTQEYPYMGHLWSLCIEEQFYIFWPFAVLFLPENRLFKVSLLLVALAVISRGALTLLGWDFISIRNLPTSQLDALVGGAIIAQLHANPKTAAAAFWKKSYTAFMCAGIAIYFMSRLAPLFPLQEPTIGLFASSIVFLSFVQYATTPGTESGFRFLDHPILRYLGRISYGIYLYHFLSLIFFYKLISMVNGEEFFAHPIIAFITLTAITILIATASWFLIERPILKLKSRLPYTGNRSNA